MELVTALAEITIELDGTLNKRKDQLRNLETQVLKFSYKEKEIETEMKRLIA